MVRLATMKVKSGRWVVDDPIKQFDNLLKTKFHSTQLIGTKNKGTVTRAAHFGRTPVSDIFRGELRSRLQREGDHSTDVMQPFFTLQLNIEVSRSSARLLYNSVNWFGVFISLRFAESQFGEGSIGKFREQRSIGRCDVHENQSRSQCLATDDIGKITGCLGIAFEIIRL